LNDQKNYQKETEGEEEEEAKENSDMEEYSDRDQIPSARSESDQE
jgi:hypothetical protein